MNRKNSAFTQLVALLAMSLALFLVLEGASSVIHSLEPVPAADTSAAADAETRRWRATVSEINVQKFDPTLGWRGASNARFKDYYAPGIDFVTNSRGLRGEREIPERIPAGERRLLCSGDSFTFGFGVRQEDAWCDQLAGILTKKTSARWSSANLGQVGYSVQQGYLFYQAEGERLDRSLDVFGFIDEDFLRDASADYFGQSKPLLELKDGKLRPINTPLTEHPSTWKEKTARDATVLSSALDHAKTLRMYWLLKKLGFNSFRAPPGTLEIARKIFEELRDSDRRKGSRLVVVRFPTWINYREPAYAKWRAAVAAAVRGLGITYVDLGEYFDQMPKMDYQALYRLGHFNAKAHALSAQEIARQLDSIPAGK